MLSRLRRAAAGYFHSRSDGKLYKRDPALKITIRIPETAGEVDARMVIHPGTSRSGYTRARQVRVEPERIELLLIHVVPHRQQPDKVEHQARLSIHLMPDGTARIMRHYPQTSDVDAERLRSIAARFLEDPSAAVAASGTHCAFCGKALTDPHSRERGIGPECFGHYGDFLRYLASAADAQAIPADCNPPAGWSPSAERSAEPEDFR
jgi:hypothetical protein